MGFLSNYRPIYCHYIGLWRHLELGVNQTDLLWCITLERLDIDENRLNQQNAWKTGAQLVIMILLSDQLTERCEDAIT